MIAALYGESVFHNKGQIKDDGLQNKDVYVDCGDDPVKELENELQGRVKEAAEMAHQRTVQKGYNKSSTETRQYSE